jgi:hypothetical protein
LITFITKEIEPVNRRRHAENAPSLFLGKTNRIGYAVDMEAYPT